MSLSKAEAVALIISHNRKLPHRVTAFLAQQAQNGSMGGVYTYSSEGPAIVTATINMLTEDGWWVVHDSVAKTLTVT